jgi:3-hydroxy acid dehydrogenase / malonic semialdehyde reductase
MFIARRKHAVDALTRSMRIDLLEKGIRVSSVSPGMVETEFSIVRFDGDAEKALVTVYKGLEPLSCR